MLDGQFSFALRGNAGNSLPLDTGRLKLAATNGVRKLRLQAQPRAGINPAPIENLLGITLPKSPQEKVNNEPTAYWLAPNDWLLVGPGGDIDSVSSALRDSAGDASAVATDMTDAWSIIDISGADAAARLAEGCSVDLHDSAFPSGCYALTRLQRLSAIIHRLDDNSRFRILVDRSVAQFLRDWLADGC